MAASMPCKDCASGTLHSGTPSGSVTTLHGLPTYVTEPPSGNPKGIIIIIPDAFGWELTNTRVLADHYAQRGDFRVYVPDFMNGTGVTPDLLTSMDKVMAENQGILGNIMKIFPGARAAYHFIPFMYQNRQAVAKPIIFNFFKALRQHEAANLPVGTAGFCWGGRYVILLCHDAEKAANGKSLVDAGFTAHPSALALPDDVEPVQKPLSIANGTLDIALTVPGMEQVKAIFAEKEKGKFELVVYEGAKHGFAVRGDPSKELEFKQGQQAEDQILSRHFMRYWLFKMTFLLNMILQLDWSIIESIIAGQWRGPEFYVYQPTNTSRRLTFRITWPGLWRSLPFIDHAGVGIANGMTSTIALLLAC